MTQKLENFKVLEKFQFLKFTKIKIFLKLPKMHNLKKNYVKNCNKKTFYSESKEASGWRDKQADGHHTPTTQAEETEP